MHARRKRACVSGGLVRVAIRGEGLPSALMHEAGDHEVVSQQSGEVALQIERTLFLLLAYSTRVTFCAITVNRRTLTASARTVSLSSLGATDGWWAMGARHQTNCVSDSFFHTKAWRNVRLWKGAVLHS
jgi:hypothetical protein